MNGVLVLDKPGGPTSFDMVARVRRAARERRVGHAGTLDPMATGVLVMCLGESTKLVPYLMDADKEYRATALLGVTTDTDDAAEGCRVIARADPQALAALTEARVVEALREQVGRIRQRPPRFSALKVQGERLYTRARDSQTAEDDDALEEHLRDKERDVTIHEITVEQVALPALTFRVRCGKGTYIRAMARDLGERLGVGGHLVALRRLRVGAFTLDRATPLEGEGQGGFAGPIRLFTPAQALSHLPALHLEPEQAQRLRHGQRHLLPDLLPRLAGLAPLVDGLQAAALDEAGQLAAVLVVEGGQLTIGRVFAPLP